MAVICTERPPLRGDVCTILWSYFSASRKAIRVESLNCVLVGAVFKIKDVKWLEYRDEGFQGAKGKEKYVEKYRSVCSIKFEAFKWKLNANLVRRSALQCRFVPLLVCTNIFRRRAAWPPPESIPRLFEPRLFQSPRLFPLAQPANTGNATWNSVHDALGKSLATYLSFLSVSLFFCFIVAFDGTTVTWLHQWICELPPTYLRLIAIYLESTHYPTNGVRRLLTVRILRSKYIASAEN